MDGQVRGRGGRQKDPSTSQVSISLEENGSDIEDIIKPGLLETQRRNLGIMTKAEIKKANERYSDFDLKVRWLRLNKKKELNEEEIKEFEDLNKRITLMFDRRINDSIDSMVRLIGFNKIVTEESVKELIRLDVEYAQERLDQGDMEQRILASDKNRLEYNQRVKRINIYDKIKRGKHSQINQNTILGAVVDKAIEDYEKSQEALDPKLAKADPMKAIAHKMKTEEGWKTFREVLIRNIGVDIGLEPQVVNLDVIRTNIIAQLEKVNLNSLAIEEALNKIESDNLDSEMNLRSKYNAKSVKRGERANVRRQYESELNELYENFEEDLAKQIALNIMKNSKMKEELSLASLEQRQTIRKVARDAMNEYGSPKGEVRKLTISEKTKEGWRWLTSKFITEKKKVRVVEQASDVTHVAIQDANIKQSIRPEKETVQENVEKEEAMRKPFLHEELISIEDAIKGEFEARVKTDEKLDDAKVRELYKAEILEEVKTVEMLSKEKGKWTLMQSSLVNDNSYGLAVEAVKQDPEADTIIMINEGLSLNDEQIQTVADRFKQHKKDDETVVISFRDNGTFAVTYLKNETKNKSLILGKSWLSKYRSNKISDFLVSTLTCSPK